MIDIFKSILDMIFPQYTKKEDLENHSFLKPRHLETPFFAFTSYKDALAREIIWSLKYKGQIKSASIIANYLNKVITQIINFHKDPFLEKIILIPAPTVTIRKWYRGYDQSFLIAKYLKNTINQNAHIYPILKRNNYSKRQTELKRCDRLKNIKGCFYVDKRFNPESKSIYIIIDDIITTGSTLRECIYTLKNAGYTNVYACAFAH